MALLNYSTPFQHAASSINYITHQLPNAFVTHPPPIPFQHQTVEAAHELQQSNLRMPYHYSQPANPFTREDQQRGHHQHHQHHQEPHRKQQQQQQQQQLDDQDVDVAPPATPHYTRVNVGSTGSTGAKTRVHAVIDYDGDYYDDEVGGDGDDNDAAGKLVRPPNQHNVTPIQGPIFLKNGSVPVVPLYSYPQLNNGSFVQIPILWTALSVALGLELKGEYIRGVPCIKRYQQLFCPTAGNTYPIDKIELFIDENKALMKRMYGEFIMGPEYSPGPPTQSARKLKRATTSGGSHSSSSDPGGGTGGSRTKPGVPDLHAEPGAESIFGNLRGTRQSFRNNQSSESGRVDACESKIEIVTPYWASNSAGKIRAIVNTQHFEQAIHQEVCAKSRTNRCSGDCGCEQKYKWHRLLAYDPDNDCKGIFMDWFLFPSCCVCRCNPT